MQQTPVNHKTRQNTNQVTPSAREMLSAAQYICICSIIQFIITPVSRKLQKVIIIPSTTPSLPSCANYKCNNPSFKMENKIVCNMQTDNTRQNYRLGHLHRFKRQCMSLKSFLELQTMYSSH
uniref:Uncharacterized protein n=1 Tax=Glycine max TaxID=3847 RepID=A0A0R0FW71_SOYBN